VIGRLPPAAKLATPVLTHALHGGGGGPRGGLPAWWPGGAARVAAAGRVVVVARGGAGLDVYDAGDAADTGAALGPGSARLSFVAGLPVHDLGQPVAVAALAFARGGVLALAGVTPGERVVVHAYKLAFSSSALSRAFPVTGSAAGGGSATGAGGGGGGARLDTAALPQLVFRAALPAGAGVTLLPHPGRDHTLGVLLAGDAAVRFFDVAPPGEGGGAGLGGVGGGSGGGDGPGGAGAALGGVEGATGAPFVAAAFSRDGRVLAAATEDGEIAVYDMAPPGGGGGGGGAGGRLAPRRRARRRRRGRGLGRGLGGGAHARRRGHGGGGCGGGRGGGGVDAAARAVGGLGGGRLAARAGGVRHAALAAVVADARGARRRTRGLAKVTRWVVGAC